MRLLWQQWEIGGSELEGSGSRESIAITRKEKMWDRVMQMEPKDANRLALKGSLRVRQGRPHRVI